ncbi:MAG TPA: hypothetical protein VHA82_05395 [Ramlibacter sp.]|uniref:hypothetical protein n=1 Tax=Ramlibacter sp. TaxID=1917967 RepID=UPI002B7F33BD|nr:hypothetical protein [Ramlibacter sp.]HVZ43225.1 hypothetical protein [Ramlibacter sp.]
MRIATLLVFGAMGLGLAGCASEYAVGYGYPTYGYSTYSYPSYSYSYTYPNYAYVAPGTVYYYHR